MRKLLVTLLAAGLCLTGVHAQETENTDGTVTNTDTNEIKTVTADTYQQIGEMEGAENAAMETVRHSSHKRSIEADQQMPA